MPDNLDVMTVYNTLLQHYGGQGWWPLLSTVGGDGAQPVRDVQYHPGDYEPPHCEDQRFEIAVGAVLTQNTAWENVRKALLTLDAENVLHPAKMLRMPQGELAGAIRPAGYFNMKARKLQALSEYWLKDNAGSVPGREELLNVWGIGPETADSILLYAFKQPHMVVDAYTRRLLGNLGVVNPHDAYDSIKQDCEASIGADLTVLQELHALIVQHGKKYYRGQNWTEPLLS